MYRIGWFSTGRGPGSRNLLKTVMDNIRQGTIAAEIPFVFCNREQGEAEGSNLYLTMVKEYGLTLVPFSSRAFNPELRKQGKEHPEMMRQWRIAYDREVLSRLCRYHADIIMLAGYMLIVGDEMCEHYDLINLHPAAPDGPPGTWQEVIWKLIEGNASQSGVMIHLATKELDLGPRITYCTFSLRDPAIHPLWESHEQKLRTASLRQIIAEEGEDNELFKEIRRRGVLRELPLIVHTLKIFSQGTVTIKDKKLLVHGRAHPNPYCLTEQIEASITHSPAP